VDNPDVEMVFERDENGLVTKFAYKVNNPGEENHRALEACEVASIVLSAEGPEDHSTTVDVNFHGGL